MAINSGLWLLGVGFHTKVITVQVTVLSILLTFYFIWVWYQLKTKYLHRVSLRKRLQRFFILRFRTFKFLSFYVVKAWGRFYCLNSYCIRNTITWNRAFVAKLSNRCFCWFPDTMLVPILMDSNISIQSPVHLAKLFLQISRISKNATIWILVRICAYLTIFTSFHFPYSGLYPWNVLLLLLLWRDSENKQ